MRAVGIVVLALSLAVWSLATIVVDSYIRPYRAIAERLETGVGHEAGYLSRVDRVLLGDKILKLCSREIARSAVTIRLASIDVAAKTQNKDTIDAALSQGDQVLRAGLRCFPQDGNFWLRLAMIEFARDGATSRVQQMLKASIDTAPGEGWIMTSRIVFAARLQELDLQGVEAILLADVLRFAAYAPVSDVADLYAQVDTKARQVFRQAASTMDSERKAALEASFEARDAGRPARN